MSAEGPVLLHRRTATATENLALDRAAAATVARLADRGLEAAVVADRLNRRKIDLIPVAQWADPKKSETDRLLAAVAARLGGGRHRRPGRGGRPGGGGVPGGGAGRPPHHQRRQARRDRAHRQGRLGPLRRLVAGASWASPARLVLIGGDEFGTVGGVPGSDSLMMVSSFARARSSSRSAWSPPRCRPAWSTSEADRPGCWTSSTHSWTVVGGTGSPASTPTRPGSSRCRPQTTASPTSLGALCNGWAGTRATPRGARRLRAASSSWAVPTAPPASCSPAPGWTALDLAQVPRLLGRPPAARPAHRGARPRRRPAVAALRPGHRAHTPWPCGPRVTPACCSVVHRSRRRPGAEGFARHDGDGGIAARVGRPGAGHRRGRSGRDGRPRRPAGRRAAGRLGGRRRDPTAPARPAGGWTSPGRPASTGCWPTTGPSGPGGGPTPRW